MKSQNDDTMKRFLLLLTIVLPMLISCNKEDIQGASLFGKWQLTKTELEQISYQNTWTTTEYYENTYYIFYEEGTVKKLDNKGGIKEYIYEYDKQNKTISFNNMEYSVKELTKSSLILCYTSHFLDGTAPTQPASGTSNTDYYFTRVKYSI